MELTNTCNNREVSFCGSGDGAPEDSWEILIIVVGETQPGQEKHKNKKNIASLAKSRIS